MRYPQVSAQTSASLYHGVPYLLMIRWDRSRVVLTDLVAAVLPQRPLLVVFLHIVPLAQLLVRDLWNDLLVAAPIDNNQLVFAHRVVL